MPRRLKPTAAIAASISAIIAAATAPAVHAQDFFAAPREFVLDRACDAHQSFRTKSNPTTLAAGTSVVGRGMNRRDNPTHAFVRVGTENKWIELGCGHFADAQPAGTPGVAQTPAAPSAPTPQDASPQACLPFFDDVDNPVRVGFGGRADITPKAPVQTAFDTAVVAACGAPGKVVARDEFKTLMRAHPAVLEAIRSFTGGKVFANRPPRPTTEDYLGELTEAWFAVHAFDHIFCGEPSAAGGGKIGGLHFHGRYLQLQQSGDACRMTNFNQNEVVPGAVYTMGVIMKNAGGGFVRDARKGYGLTLSAEDILKSATRAFAENPTASVESTGCLLALRDDGQQFTNVFVRRAAGIRTFYPDATPNGRGSPRNPPCAALVDLQK